MTPRECPSCALDAPADAEVCPFCGYEFPTPRAGTRSVTWLMILLMVLFAIPLLAWLFG
ncbi:MAG: zinc ribbon domain-containing protein [Rhodothermaceae bacterium]|nr:zinc ribbon domain-containing protein [Rhodothermaceae bacterium]